MAESRDTKRYRKRPKSHERYIQEKPYGKENTIIYERQTYSKQTKTDANTQKFQRQSNNFFNRKGPTRPISNQSFRASITQKESHLTNCSASRSVEVNGCRPKELNTKRLEECRKSNVSVRLKHKSKSLENVHMRPLVQFQDRNTDKDVKKRTIGFPFLKDLMGKDPSYIVIELTKRKSVLQECIARTAKEQDFLEFFLKVVAEAYSSKSTPKQLIGLFETLKEANFFDSIGLFLIDLSSKLEEERVDVGRIEQIIKSLLSIAMAQLQRNPSSLFVFTRIYTMINQVVEGLNKLGSLDETVLEALYQFKEWKKNSEKDIRSPSSEQGPPDDFRRYPVSPSKAELLRTGRPFLRPNKVDGQYEDLDHYLDVQFRLLREDFIGPLREGLIEYIDSKGSKPDGKKRKQTDIKIYENITVHSPVLTDHGLGYELQLAMTPSLRRIKWKQSKRLIYGSLVCLTDIDLNDFYIATVVNRDHVEGGFITVHFVEESITVENVLYRSFNMAESSAYYESYKHVLAGIQSLQPGDLPFENYILGKKVDVAHPSYLSATETYDLRPLVDQNYEVHSECRLRNMGSVIRAVSQEFSTKSKPAKSVSVCKLESWPRKELLNLDDSQYKAVQSALTKEFAIVQGPPGTGKTYIGLQIAKILLHNRSVWAGSGKTVQPMLIVCYTNHALDQFMEGIVKFFKGDVLRIGGRSNSTVLSAFNIKEIRKTRHGARTPIGIMQRNKVQAREEHYRKLREMSELTRSIELYRSEVIHERALRTVMDKHYDSLVNGMPMNMSRFKGSDFSYIFKWLGIFEIKRECRQEAVKYTDVRVDTCVSANDEVQHRMRTNIVNVSEDVTNGFSEDLVKSIRTNVIAFNADSKIPTRFKDEKEKAIHMRYLSLLRSRLARIISSTDIMSEEDASKIKDVWRLNGQTKWKLYRLWVQKFCIQEYHRIEDLKAEFEEVSERYQEALRQEDKEIMKHTSVIGMTTSGAARYISVLKEVAPKIVIVEEAAEVLESHIAMSLSKSCSHLILIGDHQQLRPNPNVYYLAKKYNLDISLFERMVKLGMEYSRLKLQHRMRPQISSIVRHIYPSLEDHESVENYPNVKGISTNLHLINHDRRETHEGEGKSYSNPHEAMYVVALCRYLLLQGYARHQITLLTTYTAQLFFMRQYLPKKEFEGVNVTVVDNYQGEENDIVILSLVRSNNDDKIGFLKIENRICVALSRAKIAFYILGNFNHLAAHSELWKNVTDDMREQGYLSDSLKLYCQNHPNDKGIEASSAADFRNAPEGGCLMICDARLSCGHKCEKHCHILDPKHCDYRCTKKCTKKCDEAGHPCKAKCYEKCPPCNVRVKKIVPTCYHEQEMMCCTDPKDFTCLFPCQSKLKCGHRCTKACGEVHTKNCLVVIDHTWSCGHTAKIQCWQKESKKCSHPCDHTWPCGHTAKILCWQKESKKCPHPCEFFLKCEHQCEGTCGSCFNGRVHIACRNKCTRNLVCGHQCSSYCNVCLPCKEQCRNRCIHSRCKLKCGESCKLCKEPCAWRCKHYQCSKLCYEVCDRPKCNRPCQKKIKHCKHKCIGLCGEPCPTLCRICDKARVTEVFFGDEDRPGARFVLLEDCKHIIEYRAMDKYMCMNDKDETIKLKCCPKCSTPIQKSLRYGNIINDVLRNIERVKIEMIGNTDKFTSNRKYMHQNTTDLTRFCRARFIESPLRVNTSTLVSEQQQITFENQKKLAEAWFKVKSALRLQLLSMPEGVEKFSRSQTELMSSISDPTDWFTEQQVEDFSLELKRSRMVVNFCEVLKHLKRAYKTEEADSDIEVLKNNLLCYDRFTEEKVAVVKECMNKLVEMTQIKGLGITEEERLDIVKAVGLSKGHWFKCPNNHIYAIGECGGATQRGKCPECKAEIGGESHRLADGNAVAKEMDGARYAAYSEEANNMANFDLNNLF